MNLARRILFVYMAIYDNPDGDGFVIDDPQIEAWILEISVATGYPVEDVVRWILHDEVERLKLLKVGDGGNPKVRAWLDEHCQEGRSAIMIDEP